MPYSGEELDEIGRDPVRLRGYFWRVAMGARLRAARAREDAQKGLTRDLRWASLEEDVSRIILDNLDALVESSLER
jgi:hypothetical protein